MKKTTLGLSLSVMLALGACKPAGTAGQGGATAPATQQPAQGQAARSDLRLNPDHVVATWDGGKMTYGELYQKKGGAFKKLYNKYLQDLHQNEQRELEGHIIETLVNKAAEKAGKSPTDYMQGLAGAPEVSDAEVQAFYDQNLKARGEPFDAVKDRVRGFLAGQKQREVIQKEIDRLKAEAHVKLDLPAPESAKASFELAGRPMKGNPSAKVTVVEFSDFQCPYCSRAVTELKALTDAFPNDVKVYFLHYPLSFHQEAMPAAIASQCANTQGKFWEFHDRLFAQQQQLSAATIESTAKEIGLDADKFKACREDPATRALVQADMEQGEAAGVEGTPSFYVNGMASQHGVPTPETIRQALAGSP